jgi:hypothetical protein
MVEVGLGCGVARELLDELSEAAWCLAKGVVDGTAAWQVIASCLLRMPQIGTQGRSRRQALTDSSQSGQESFNLN